jgi:YD repeat-containing protein
MAQEAIACGTTTYSYDVLGRLVRTSDSSGMTSTFSYDAADNRKHHAVVPGAGCGTAGGQTVGGIAMPGASFESPALANASFVYRPTVQGAAFEGASGVARNALGFAAAPRGEQIGFLQGGSGPARISLDVSGLTPGATYKISFSMARAAGMAALPLTVSFESVSLGSFTPVSEAWTSVTTGTFVALGRSGILSFTGAMGAAGQIAGIDSVVLLPAEASPPAPPARRAIVLPAPGGRYRIIPLPAAAP